MEKVAQDARQTKKIFTARIKDCDLNLLGETVDLHCKKNNIKFFLTSDGLLFMAHTRKKFDFKQGMISASHMLKIPNQEFEELAKGEQTLYSKLNAVLDCDGYDAEFLPNFVNKNYTDKEFVQLCKDSTRHKKVARDNKRVLGYSSASSTDITDNLKSGNLDASTVMKEINTGEELNETLRKKAVTDKPVLKGTISWNHYLYKEDPTTGLWHPDKDCKPVTVSFTGTDDFLRKRKHLWIYSKSANWGKSTTIYKEIVTPYNADILQDVNNAENLTRNTRIIVCDEYSSQRKIDISTLKALTSGNASTGSLNIKSFGRSYIPHPAAQFIILSNQSPAEAYSSNVDGMRVIDRNLLGQVNARFDIHCLDGNHEEETTKWLDPKTLKKEELWSHIRMNTCDFPPPVRTASYFITMVNTIYKILQRSSFYVFGIHIDEFARILSEFAPLENTFGFSLTWTAVLNAMNTGTKEFVHSNRIYGKQLEKLRTKIEDVIHGAERSEKGGENRMKRLIDNMGELYQHAVDDNVNEVETCSKIIFSDKEHILMVLNLLSRHRKLTPEIAELINSQKRKREEDEEEEKEESCEPSKKRCEPAC